MSILMNKNIPVLKLEVDHMGNIVDVKEKINIEYLPIGIDCTFGSPNRKELNRWWIGRGIPASRSGLREALEIMKIDVTSELLTKNMGLSLSDQYWMKPENSKLSWEDVNFFQNEFSDDVGKALFSEGFAGDFMSPNNTSDGWLKKKWMIKDGKRVLLKTGSGESQQEPLNEVLANIICKRLRINDYVTYEVGYTEDYAYCVCENFISENEELVSANMVMKSKKKKSNESYYQHYVSICEEMGLDIKPRLDDMLILDYIICNRDRHYNNFGIVRNVETLKIEKVAPIFDSGTSAFSGVIETKIGNLALNSSKPFLENHEEQIGLIQDIEKYDFSTLYGIEEEFCEVLRHSPFILPSRRDTLTQWLKRRVEPLWKKKTFTKKDVQEIVERAKQTKRKVKNIK